MTDHNPVSGKDHVGYIMMSEAITKLTVGPFRKTVFNGPDEIASAGEEGEQKKDEEVACEKGHNKKDASEKDSGFL